jgi:hypothetical protein
MHIAMSHKTSVQLVNCIPRRQRLNNQILRCFHLQEQPKKEISRLQTRKFSTNVVSSSNASMPGQGAIKKLSVLEQQLIVFM